MKLKNLLLSTAILASIQSARSAEDFIIQTDLETGLSYYIYVQGPDDVGERDGRVPSIVPIGPKGARFELFGVGLEPDNKLYPLAETVVGTFLPKATVSISSDDPYSVVPRVRADETFRASMEFSDLLTGDDEEIPESAKVAYVERLAVEYAEGEDRVSITGTTNHRVIEAFYVTKNGKLETSLQTQLKSDFAYKQKGEELIRVYALPDNDLGWTVIDEQKVHVWPIADGSIKGVYDSGSTYDLADQKFAHVPNIVINLSDLYPTSKTSLRIYKGNKTDEATGSQVITQIEADDYDPLSFNTTVPQSASQLITSEQWEQYAKEDGIYTVELITVTPFNGGKPERMAYATFELDRTIVLKGSVISSE